MKPGVKRALKIVVGVVLVVVLGFAGLIASAFVGRSDIQDGAEPVPAVRIVKDGIVSVGVVDVGGGKVALVDAGVDQDGKALLAELARRKLGPDAVTAIFLTHGHGDHLAASHLFTAASVYALATEIPLLDGSVGSTAPIGRMMGKKPTGVKLTRGLKDGETVDVGDTHVRVFAIPGHTPGSAAYLVDGVLFLGDSAGASKDGRLLPAPWAFSDDAAQNRASLKSLGERLRPEAASIKALAPAHCGLLKGLDPLLAFAP
jgi:glyoxylase-like metal-dependent hydrolase (beta-lactamase superfamily II)